MLRVWHCPWIGVPTREQDPPPPDRAPERPAAARGAPPPRLDTAPRPPGQRLPAGRRVDRAGRPQRPRRSRPAPGTQRRPRTRRARRRQPARRAPPARQADLDPRTQPDRRPDPPPERSRRARATRPRHLGRDPPRLGPPGRPHRHGRGLPGRLRLAGGAVLVGDGGVLGVLVVGGLASLPAEPAAAEPAAGGHGGAVGAGAVRAVLRRRPPGAGDPAVALDRGGGRADQGGRPGGAGRACDRVRDRAERGGAVAGGGVRPADQAVWGGVAAGGDDQPGLRVLRGVVAQPGATAGGAGLRGGVGAAAAGHGEPRAQPGVACPVVAADVPLHPRPLITRAKEALWSGSTLPAGRPSVLEGVRRVVPGLAAGDLEAAADLGVAVDADDLLALRALPALEPVSRALQLHARAALVTDLALQGRGGGAAVVGAHSRRLLAPPGRCRDAPPGWPNSGELAPLRWQLPHTDLVSAGPARCAA